MPCPNCNNTLQNLGLDQTGRRTFWCPNCGSLKWERRNPAGDVFVETDTPNVILRLNNDDEFRAWEEEYRNRRDRMQQPPPDGVIDERCDNY